jgi:GNAT superfamily N-acetyltransferase
MATIPLSLDGYTDLPPGKIANVVTFLEMTAPPAGPKIDRGDLGFRLVPSPDLSWYRALNRRIGEQWLWFNHAVTPDEKLRAQLASPLTEVCTLSQGDALIGLAELNRAVPGEVEIAMFGVVPEAIGTGAGRFMMDEALARGWIPGVKRVWLHTCTFDHPGAIPFYLARGFTPYKYAIEVSDDPRLTGHLPSTAGPHVPLIRP